MSFLNPLLLLGALGVGLPILAHLINLQQLKRTDWAAMQFLDRNVRVRSRQLKLRDILLLVMRCLALVALVFALARPATRSDGALALVGEEHAGVVIAIDASFSMDHADDNTSRFERALEQARIIGNHVNPGDPVTLVMLGGDGRVVLRNKAFQPDTFASALEALKVSAEPLNLGNAPKQLIDLVDDMDAPQKEVYLISDCQSKDWKEMSAQLLQSLTDLSQRARVFMIGVPGGDENLAITDMSLVSGSLRKDSVARYRATIHNFGSSPVSNVEVRCKVEGAQIDSKRIPLIAPGASETVSLFVPFYNAGPTRVTAEIDDDGLKADNERYIVAVVRERVSVLVVDGSTTGDAGRLIAAALLARAAGASDEDYAVRTVQWPSLSSAEIDQSDIVILADVPEITPDQNRQLARFVRQGNGLIWFGGERVKAAAWNGLNSGRGDALLPATLGAVLDVRDSLGVGKPLSSQLPDHMVCRPLGSLPKDLINETRFWNCIAVDVPDTSFVVLDLAGSKIPVLLEHALGRGSVLMFTTSAQTEWNNMAQTPVFPMLIQQIVTYLASREFERPRLVGDSLALAYVEQPDASDAVFESPNQESMTVPVLEHHDQYMALLDRSREAGFYVARVSVQAPGMPIAVNVDTGESDVACLTSDEMRERLQDTGVTLTGGDTELAAGITEARTERSLWRVFLYAGFLFLVAECLFADRMLRKRSHRGGESPTETGRAS